MADETQDVATEVDPSTPIANAVVADEVADTQTTDTATPAAPAPVEEQGEHVAFPDRPLPEGAVIR